MSTTMECIFLVVVLIFSISGIVRSEHCSIDDAWTECEHGCCITIYHYRSCCRATFNSEPTPASSTPEILPKSSSWPKTLPESSSWEAPTSITLVLVLIVVSIVACVCCCRRCDRRITNVTHEHTLVTINENVSIAPAENAQVNSPQLQEDQCSLNLAPPQKDSRHGVQPTYAHNLVSKQFPRNVAQPTYGKNPVTTQFSQKDEHQMHDQIPSFQQQALRQVAQPGYTHPLVTQKQMSQDAQPAHQQHPAFQQQDAPPSYGRSLELQC